MSENLQNNTSSQYPPNENQNQLQAAVEDNQYRLEHKQDNVVQVQEELDNHNNSSAFYSIQEIVTQPYTQDEFSQQINNLQTIQKQDERNPVEGEGHAEVSQDVLLRNHQPKEQIEQKQAQIRVEQQQKPEFIQQISQNEQPQQINNQPAEEQLIQGQQQTQKRQTEQMLNEKTQQPRQTQPTDQIKHEQQIEVAPVRRPLLTQEAIQTQEVQQVYSPPLAEPLQTQEQSKIKITEPVDDLPIEQHLNTSQQSHQIGNQPQEQSPLNFQQSQQTEQTLELINQAQRPTCPQQLNQNELITLAQSIYPSQSSQETDRKQTPQIQENTQEINLSHPKQQFASALKPSEERLFTLAYSEQIAVGKTNESLEIEKPEPQVVMKESISFSDFNCSDSVERSNEPKEDHAKNIEEIAQPLQVHQQTANSQDIPKVQVTQPQQQEQGEIETAIQSIQQVAQTVQSLPQTEHKQQSVAQATQIPHLQQVIQIRQAQAVAAHQDTSAALGHRQVNRNLAVLSIPQQPMIKSSSAQVSGVYISSDYEEGREVHAQRLDNLKEEQSEQLKSEHEHATHQQTQKLVVQERQDRNSELVQNKGNEANSQIGLQQSTVVKNEQISAMVQHKEQSEQLNMSSFMQDEKEVEVLIDEKLEFKKQKQHSDQQKTPLALKLIQSTLLGVIAASGLIWQREYKLGYAALGLVVFAGSFFLRK